MRCMMRRGHDIRMETSIALRGDRIVSSALAVGRELLEKSKHRMDGVPSQNSLPEVEGFGCAY